LKDENVIVLHAASQSAHHGGMKIRSKPAVAVYTRGANERVGAAFLSGGQRTSSRTAGGGGPGTATASLWLRPGVAEVHYNYYGERDAAKEGRRRDIFVPGIKVVILTRYLPAATALEMR